MNLQLLSKHKEFLYFCIKSKEPLKNLKPAASLIKAKNYPLFSNFLKSIPWPSPFGIRKHFLDRKPSVSIKLNKNNKGGTRDTGIIENCSFVGKEERYLWWGLGMMQWREGSQWEGGRRAGSGPGCKQSLVGSCVHCQSRAKVIQKAKTNKNRSSFYNLIQVRYLSIRIFYNWSNMNSTFRIEIYHSGEFRVWILILIMDRQHNWTEIKLSSEKYAKLSEHKSTFERARHPKVQDWSQKIFGTQELKIFILNIHS